MNSERFIKMMYRSLDIQRQNVDQFFTAHKATVTDIYRINQSLERRTVVLDRLRQLLKQKELLSKDSLEYARVMSEISMETGMLSGVIQENQKQLENIKKTSQFQLKICGKMLHLKKEITKIVEKANNLLRS